MEIFARIAEQRIREAMDRGELDNLANRGRPLVFEDDSLVPEDLRLARKILRNAGFAPPEVELRGQIASLRSLVAGLDDGPERARRLRELNYKMLKFSELVKRPPGLEDFPGYEIRFYEKALDEGGPGTPNPEKGAEQSDEVAG